MKKLINILFKVQLLILLIGSISNNYSQSYLKINEQTASYTAGSVQTTSTYTTGEDNHIFWVAKDVNDNWLDIEMQVRLGKAQFRNTSDNSTFGFGTGNGIPNGWYPFIKKVEDEDGNEIPADNINKKGGVATNGWFKFPKEQMGVQIIKVILMLKMQMIMWLVAWVILILHII